MSDVVVRLKRRRDDAPLESVQVTVPREKRRRTLGGVTEALATASLAATAPNEQINDQTNTLPPRALVFKRIDPTSTGLIASDQESTSSTTATNSTNNNNNSLLPQAAPLSTASSSKPATSPEPKQLTPRSAAAAATAKHPVEEREDDKSNRPNLKLWTTALSKQGKVRDAHLSSTLAARGAALAKARDMTLPTKSPGSKAVKPVRVLDLVIKREGRRTSRLDVPAKSSQSSTATTDKIVDGPDMTPYLDMVNKFIGEKDGDSAPRVTLELAQEGEDDDDGEWDYYVLKSEAVLAEAPSMEGPVGLWVPPDSHQQLVEEWWLGSPTDGFGSPVIVDPVSDDDSDLDAKEHDYGEEPSVMAEVARTRRRIGGGTNFFDEDDIYGDDGVVLTDDDERDYDDDDDDDDGFSVYDPAYYRAFKSGIGGEDFESDDEDGFPGAGMRMGMVLGDQNVHEPEPSTMQRYGRPVWGNNQSSSS